MTKRIAIDSRKFDDFGIGRTIRGILHGIEEIQPSGLEILVLGPASIADRIPSSPLFRLVQEDAPHYSLREIHRVGRSAEREGADLLHIPHYVTPSTSLPMTTTIHDLIHLRTPRRNLPFGGRLYARWMLRRATARSARIVTVSEAVKNEIEQELPSARGKIRIVPNGVDRPADEPVPLDRRDPFILFAGNDKPHKNIDRLVEAFVNSRESFPETSLVLVGSPFERFVGRDGVRVRGFVEDSELVDLYRRAKALVQPSLFEGFGLPVAEAMSHGTPVIVSAIPPLLEVAGEAAIPIDEPEDVESIANTLRHALRDEERLESSGARGRDLSSRFRWSAAARALVDLWDEVLETGSDIRKPI